MTNEEHSEPRESALAAGWQVQPERPGKAPEPEAQAIAGADDERGMSSLAVMLLGVFGGLYLLYTWGWFAIASAYAQANAAAASASGIVGGILQQIVFWIAPLAPLMWFITAYILTRHRGTLARSLALLLGAILLLPLPFVLGGGA